MHENTTKEQYCVELEMCKNLAGWLYSTQEKRNVVRCY